MTISSGQRNPAYTAPHPVPPLTNVHYGQPIRITPVTPDRGVFVHPVHPVHPAPPATSGTGTNTPPQATGQTPLPAPWQGNPTSPAGQYTPSITDPSISGDGTVAAAGRGPSRLPELAAAAAVALVLTLAIHTYRKHHHHTAG